MRDKTGRPRGGFNKDYPAAGRPAIDVESYGLTRPNCTNDMRGQKSERRRVFLLRRKSDRSAAVGRVTPHQARDSVAELSAVITCSYARHSSLSSPPHPLHRGSSLVLTENLKHAESGTDSPSLFNTPQLFNFEQNERPWPMKLTVSFLKWLQNQLKSCIFANSNQSKFGDCSLAVKSTL